MSEKTSIQIVDDERNAFLEQLRELRATSTDDLSTAATTLSLKVHHLILTNLIKTLSPNSLPKLYAALDTEQRKIGSEILATADVKYFDILDFGISLLFELAKGVCEGVRPVEESLEDTAWLELRAGRRMSGEFAISFGFCVLFKGRGDWKVPEWIWPSVLR
ncbi:hypothetical protein ACMFMG_004172 [Clarireedia jacksonii]